MSLDACCRRHFVLRMSNVPMLRMGYVCGSKFIKYVICSIILYMMIFVCIMLYACFMNVAWIFFMHVLCKLYTYCMHVCICFHKFYTSCIQLVCTLYTSCLFVYCLYTGCFIIVYMLCTCFCMHVVCIHVNRCMLHICCRHFILCMLAVPLVCMWYVCGSTFIKYVICNM